MVLPVLKPIFKVLKKTMYNFVDEEIYEIERESLDVERITVSLPPCLDEIKECFRVSEAT